MICTAVPTVSIHRLTSLLFSTKVKNVSNKKITTVSSSKLRLDHLPDEILTCVFEQLGSLSTIYQFALTSQKLYSIAATPRSLACWLTFQKGNRFSIYYAILAMPHLCDDHFIRLLINQGALLSRHLVQQLVTLYGKSSTSSSLFNQCIQQLPFSGYAVLIHHGFQLYGNILVGELDFQQLMTGSTVDQMHAWHVAIHEHYFLPAPLVSSSYSRHLLRLADTRPDLFDLIAPVFEFDREARHALWECIFLLLLDVSFTQHPIEYHQSQLACLGTIITPHKVIRFTTPIMRRDLKKGVAREGDLDVFGHAFISFFTKYPTGYCH
ncbi:hypothetical protein BC941DRAFT_411815, partial [Chlamydoabsidia padenii]